MDTKRFSSSPTDLQTRLIADMERKAKEQIKQTKTLLAQLENHLNHYTDARQAVPDIIDQLSTVGTMTRNEIIETFDIPKELTTRPRKKKQQQTQTQNPSHNEHFDQ